ncbi:Choline/Carnitine o-acyltransferase-domain-containing protein [Aspergillus egyptiacus]|nr:Choline/Carnitine o-acyltransferase-domain-containing protein [Aspergillus egyptiacus]
MSPVQPIAIIGMGCRFPGGANGPERFWEMLSEGRSAWSDTPSDRYNWKAFYNSDPTANGSHNHRGGHFLDQNIAAFDARFFGITPVEAKAMDPQQRIQLEIVFEALENAGIPSHKIRNSNTSVYVSVFNHDYDRMLFKDCDDIPQYHITGNGQAILSNRISYLFDLKGPSLTLDTGCSGGLVALNQACQSLRTGESKMAIVGGVNLILSPEAMIPMSMLRFFSNEGKCFTFDERGSGYGRGEGVGAVILKPLQDAIADGDPVRAVIQNTFVNQDGKTAGITLPNIDSQKALLQRVYEQAGLDPRDTAYVECHGTGTAAGDPIETEAIGTVLAQKRQGPLRIGSAKTNIGHLESASGLAGLIKTVLMLEKGQVPPNLNFEFPNQEIKLDEWNLKVCMPNPFVCNDTNPLEVPLTLEPWPAEGSRQASVNSFGYGGTNAHAILTSPAELPRSAGELSTAPQLFPISASTQASLRSVADNLKQWIAAQPRTHASFRDLVYTLSCRRTLMPWRSTIVASSYDELHTSLDELTGTRAEGNPAMVFIFSGQGAQWAGMGRELLGQPIFEKSIARSEDILRDLGAKWSLKDELLLEDGTSRINNSEIGQPASTALQIALVDMLSHWDLMPEAVVGHSSGEIAAAYAAGFLTHRDALTVSYYRGFLSSISRQLSGVQGGMLAVGLGQTEVTPYLNNLSLDNGRVCVACVNSPTSTTISGDACAIGELHRILDGRGIFNRVLHVDTAYHSHHMALTADEYIRRLEGIQDTGAPQGGTPCRFISTVTGKEKTSGFDASYWVENLVSPVRFSDALANVCREISPAQGRSCPIVEIGPHSVLAGPVKQILSSLDNRDASFPYIPTLRRRQDAHKNALECVGKLLELGCPVNMERVNHASGFVPRVLSDLPPYAWDHSTTYWHESRLSREYRLREHGSHALLGVRRVEGNSFQPTWRSLINTDTAPWVRGHVVMDNVVFPAAGYMVMAMEAMRQIYGSTHPIHRYNLRDVYVEKAMTVPDAPELVEMQLSLQSRGGSMTDWHEFRVFSVTGGTDWVEHCRGLVCIRGVLTADNVEAHGEEQVMMASHRETVERIRAQSPKSVTPEELYSNFGAHGLVYDGPFIGVSELQVSDSNSIGVVKPHDPSLEMPAGYQAPRVLHPGTLDACLQCAVPLALDQESLMPTFFEEIMVSGHVGCEEALVALTTLKYADSQTAILDQLVAQNSPDASFCLSIAGMNVTKFKSLEDSESTRQARNTTYHMEFRPDIDYIPGSSIIAGCTVPLSPDEISSAGQRHSMLERASAHFINVALQTLARDGSVGDMAPHHQHLLRWMKAYQSRTTGSDQTPQETRSILCELETSCVEGKMLARIGRNLTSILRGETPPLSVMLQDDLLYQVYNDDSSRRCYAHMAKYLEHLAYKNPHMKILEVGAGTGGATSVVLDTLTHGEDRMFRSYDFTDISSGFFEKAGQRFTAHKDRMQFRRLNIEQDPMQQGFEEGTYDLVIAANVLHATSSMEQTVTNTRRLLKPGGRLLLLELTQPTAYHGLVFGTLPGWWQGVDDGRPDSPLLTTSQWNTILTRASFSGLDVAIPDFPGDTHAATFMVSKAVLPDAPSRTLNARIVDFKPNTSRSPSGKAISDSLDRMGLSWSRSAPSGLEGGPETIHIILDDEEQSLLETVDASTFKDLTNLISVSKNILWISCSTREAGNSAPGRALTAGFARAARTENPGLMFVTLDIEKRRLENGSEAVQLITSILESSFTNPSNSAVETELVEQNGVLCIPRLLPDDSGNKHMADRLDEPTVAVQPFHGTGRCLKLEVESPGLLDTMRFIDNPDSATDLGNHEVEFKVRAIGVNFRDVMVALGQLQGDTLMAGDMGGIVTRVGVYCTRVRVGDRICAWGANTYKNVARVTEFAACPIPDQMSFCIAASIPCVFITAYHCLIDVARLTKGQSILIHSAAGGVGQAAIKIGQLLGAHVFATVGSAQKKQLLVDEYGIPESHIFSSNRRSFKQGVLRLTGGQGVDVVLNSLSGEFLHDSWACTAMFGTFVEIGKTDILRKTKLDMSGFEGMKSFVAVDLHKLITHRPEKMAPVLDKVIQLFTQEALTPISPTVVKPISQLEDAFRIIQSRKHVGKVVLDCAPGSMVKALTPKPSFEFSDTASYLICGGTGGLGVEICRWMASHGAKNLITLSRSGSKSTAIAKLQAVLLNAGTTLTVYQGDVSDRRCVQDIIQQCNPAVKGIIHAGMVLQDRSLERMDVQDFQTVLAVKKEGTMSLVDAVAEGPPLDFFIMLSSCVGVIGNAGQANYAAGSTFQDALSGCQLPNIKSTVSLDLGMIQGAGYANERPETVKALTSQGFSPIPLNELMALLEYSIRSASLPTFQHRQLIIGLRPSSSIDERDSDAYDRQSALRDPKFGHVRRATDTGKKEVSQSKANDWKALVREATTKGQAHHIIAETIVKKISALTLADNQALDLMKPLSALGLDSLVSVELRNWIARTFECAVKVSDILQSDSSVGLARFVCQQSKSSVLADLGEMTVSTEATVSTPCEVESSPPQLPLPKLNDTIQRYLTSVVPLASETELETTSRLTADFLRKGGFGETLQQRLIDLQNAGGHWLHEIYQNATYLEDRRPLMPFTSYFAAHPSTARGSPARTAAIISWAAFQFKRLLDQGSLKAERIADGAICMDSYRWMFNACRMPGSDVDAVTKWPSQDFLVAMRRGHLFKLPLCVAGRPAAVDELAAGFEGIIRRADLHQGEYVGVLTRDTRDRWHQHRNAIIDLCDANKSTVEAVESADFIVCLDAATPTTAEERSRQVWYGDGSNRWYDKPVQFVVCDNGASGFVGEHSMMDGLTTRRLNEHIIQALGDRSQSDSSTTESLEVSLLPITVTPQLQQQIDALHSGFPKAMEPVRVTMVDCPEYGTGFIKERKYNPNAFVNMILQVAVQKLYGGLVATYEPVSLASFSRGRLDICRVVTSQVHSFCKAMAQDRHDKAVCRTLLQAAIKQHNRLVASAGKGQGIDNHLMALQRMVREGEEMPSIFTDPSFVRSSHYTLCTTSLESSSDEIGFYPVVDDGWGISFILRESRIRLSVISANPEHDEFCRLLHEAALEVKSIFEGDD